MIKDYRRLRTFLAGTVFLAAVSAGGTLIVTQLAAKEMLAREGQVSQAFIAGIAKAEGIGPGDIARAKAVPRFDSFASHVANLPGVVRLTIYSEDGFIRYSTEQQLVGVKFEDNDELAEALAGKVTVVTEDTETVKSEHLGLALPSSGSLIEAYIPVPGAEGKIIGVVEYYALADGYEAAHRALSRHLWLTSAGTFAVLAAALGFAAATGRLAR